MLTPTDVSRATLTEGWALAFRAQSLCAEVMPEAFGEVGSEEDPALHGYGCMATAGKAAGRCGCSPRGWQSPGATP